MPEILDDPIIEDPEIEEGEDGGEDTEETTVVLKTTPSLSLNNGDGCRSLEWKR